jgi:hypothetical protein
MAGPDRGHEVRDVELKWIVGFAIILAVVLVATFALMRWTFHRFEQRERARQGAPVSLVEPQGASLPPEPRLQANPRQELKAMRAEEEAILGSYGWVDRELGIVRIPIDAAMEIVVQQGIGEDTVVRGDRGESE